MLSALESKFLAIAVVTIGSLIFGTFPAVLGLGRRYQNSTILSAVLCFGGGVLFSTSVIHILPDVRNDLPKWSELIFCVGFLLIYFTDSVFTYFKGNSYNLNPPNEEAVLPTDQQRYYGTVDFGAEPSVNFNDGHSRVNTWNSGCMNFGMILAFTVHAVLEGLVIGIQDTEYGVVLLLGAVCSHKFLVAFCLGAELVAQGRSWKNLIWPLGIFIFGSDLGILIGMIFESDGLASLHTTVPLLEGLAGGTLLYISLCEVVPRERSKKLPSYASLVQFGALFGGFSVMTALIIFA